MSGIMDFLSRQAERLQQPNTQDRLAGLGSVLMALDQGQAADVSPYLNSIRARESGQELSARLADPNLMGRFTPEQRAILATMPPEAAQQIIAQTLFTPEPVGEQFTLDSGETRFDAQGNVIAEGMAPEASRNTQVVGGRLIDLDTYEVLYEPPTGHVPMTAEEIQAARLDPAAPWFRDPDGRPYNPEASGGDTINVNGEQENEFQKVTGRGQAEEMQALAAQGVAASRNLVRLQELEALLETAPQGAAGSLQRFGASLGLDVDGSDVATAAEAIISAMVPEQRPEGSGTMSDADLALFKRSLPSLGNTPQGNALIVRTMRRIAEYDAQLGAIARAVQGGSISYDEGIRQMQSLANPVAEALEAARANPTSPSTSPSTSSSGGASATPTRRVYNPETGGFD